MDSSATAARRTPAPRARPPRRGAGPRGGARPGARLHGGRGARLRQRVPGRRALPGGRVRRAEARRHAGVGAPLGARRPHPPLDAARRPSRCSRAGSGPRASPTRSCCCAPSGSRAGSSPGPRWRPCCLAVRAWLPSARWRRVGLPLPRPPVLRALPGGAPLLGERRPRPSSCCRWRRSFPSPPAPGEAQPRRAVSLRAAGRRRRRAGARLRGPLPDRRRWRRACSSGCSSTAGTAGGPSPPSLAGMAFPLALGLAVDAWGYGSFEVVPWRYLDVNLVEGKAASFGTSPLPAYLVVPGRPLPSLRARPPPRPAPLLVALPAAPPHLGHAPLRRSSTASSATRRSASSSPSSRRPRSA